MSTKQTNENLYMMQINIESFYAKKSFIFVNICIESN